MLTSRWTARWGLASACIVFVLSIAALLTNGSDLRVESVDGISPAVAAVADEPASLAVQLVASSTPRGP